MSPLACVKCGVAIHPDTAKWNAGLCMPCARRRPPGAEERLEAAAARYLAENPGSASDAREADYQAGLASRVHGPGGSLDQLVEHERHYFLLSALLMQLREGSVFCFFDNSPGDHYLEVLELLQKVGLQRIAEGLAQAKKVLFGDNAVPRDVSTRRQLMPTNREGEPRREVRKALAAIDGQTQNAEDAIEEMMREIARANQLY